jgi:FKBP-type peptidyl-prolyl cis-trans isomerase 2
MKYIFALFAVFLVLGCVENMESNSVVVAAGDHVSVDYTGKLEDGTVFDSSSGRGPLEFDAGAGQMIAGFDAAVIGMKEGDEKTITILPQDAYGMPDPNLVFEVPLANVPEGTKAGDQLYAGNQVVTVIAVTNETATIDANHQLAGRTLIFDIKMVSIVKK